MKELCLKYGIVVCPKSEPTRQMVLGTDNIEKEAACEGSRPMAPDTTSLVLLPCIQTWPHIQEHPFHKSQLKYVP